MYLRRSVILRAKQPDAFHRELLIDVFFGLLLVALSLVALWKGSPPENNGRSG